jgi:hypothetical protein
LAALFAKIRKMFVGLIESIQVAAYLEVISCFEEDQICWNDSAYFRIQVYQITHDYVFGVDKVLLTVSEHMGQRNGHKAQPLVYIDINCPWHRGVALLSLVTRCAAVAEERLEQLFEVKV